MGCCRSQSEPKPATQVSSRIPKMLAEEAAAAKRSRDQASTQKPVPRAVARTKQSLETFQDGKLVRPGNSGSPLSLSDSIPAVRP